MFIILSVPLCCLPTQAARPAATPIDAIDAPMDRISSNAIGFFFHLNRYIKGYGITILKALKGQRSSTVLSSIISFEEANYFKVKAKKSQSAEARLLQRSDVKLQATRRKST
jgi:hypothetical protein